MFGLYQFVFSDLLSLEMKRLVARYPFDFIFVLPRLYVVTADDQHSGDTASHVAIRYFSGGGGQHEAHRDIFNIRLYLAAAP